MRKFLAHIDIEKNIVWTITIVRFFIVTIETIQFTHSITRALFLIFFTPLHLNHAFPRPQNQRPSGTATNATHQVVPQNVDWSVHIHRHLNKTWTYSLSASWTSTSIFGLSRILAVRLSAMIWITIITFKSSLWNALSTHSGKYIGYSIYFTCALLWYILFCNSYYWWISVFSSSKMVGEIIDPSSSSSVSKVSSLAISLSCAIY